MKKTKRKSNKTSFTVVELIAVMVVLAIILVIAAPTIRNILRPSTVSAFQSDARLFFACG